MRCMNSRVFTGARRGAEERSDEPPSRATSEVPRERSDREAERWMKLANWCQGAPAHVVRRVTSHGSYAIYTCEGTRDLFVQHSHAYGSEYTRVDADTFIAMTSDLAPMVTIGSSYVFLRFDPVWYGHSIVAVSSRLSSRMQTKYKCMGPSMRYPIAWMQALGTDGYTAAAFTLLGRIPTRPCGRNGRHRGHPRWRCVNGGHLQRCVTAIVLVHVADPCGRVIVHFGDFAVVLRGVYRIELSSYGEIFVNEGLTVSRDRLHRYITDRDLIVGASRPHVRRCSRRRK